MLLVFEQIRGIGSRPTIPLIISIFSHKAIFTMEYQFELPVTYNGTKLNLSCRLSTYTYVYRFYIIIQGEEIVFEKDNEGKYRALSEKGVSDRSFDMGLVETVVRVLDNLSQV